MLVKKSVLIYIYLANFLFYLYCRHPNFELYTKDIFVLILLISWPLCDLSSPCNMKFFEKIMKRWSPFNFLASTKKIGLINFSLWNKSHQPTPYTLEEGLFFLVLWNYSLFLAYFFYMFLFFNLLFWLSYVYIPKGCLV